MDYDLKPKVKEVNVLNEWLFNNFSTPIFILNLVTGKFLDVNKSAVIKYAYSKEEFLSRSWFDVSPCSINPDYTGTDIKCLIKNFSECRHITKRGEILDVKIEAFFFRIFEVDAAAVVVKDINVYKESLSPQKKDLLLTNDSPLTENIKLLNVLNSIKEIIFQTDAAGNCIYLSPVFEEITGYTIGETLNKNFLSFIHPDDKKNCRRKFKLLLRSKNQTKKDEVRYINKNGGVRWFGIYIQPYFDDKGKLHGTSGTLNDITEGKLYEEKLLVRNRALNSAMNGIIITDPQLNDNPIIYCNDAFEKITGYKKEEVIGKNCRFLQGAETSNSAVDQIRDAIFHNKECKVTLLNYKKDGTKFWNDLSISPVKDRKGNVINYIGIQADITERIDAIKALRRSEEKLRSIVEQLDDGIVLTDEDGIVIEWNKKIESVTGLRADNTLGKYLWDIPALVKIKNEAGLKELIREILQTGERVTRENVLYSFDGTEKYIRVFALPIKTDKGYMLCNIIRDLTKQREDEEEIRKLSRAVETSPSGILLADLNGKIVYINPSVLSIGNYLSADEILNKTIFDFTDKNGGTRLQDEIIPSLVKGGTWKGELLAYKKDGQTIPIELSCGLVNHDTIRPQYLLAVFNDISERKKAEYARIESEKKYRNVVNNVKEVIFQTDAEGRWIFLNPAWEEITGYVVEESIGNYFLNYIHPDDRERNFRLFLPLINRKKDYCRHTIRYTTKDGGFKWIEVFARLTFDENNNTTGTSGTLNDISERKKAEEEVKLMLEKEIELNELKSRFVSTISHEFRTPLTSILASSELLQRYNAKWGDEKKMDTLKRIEKSVLFMNEMINDVLTLNRADTGRLGYNPSNIDITRIARNVLEEIKVAASPLHKFITDFDSELNEVFMDEKLMRNIISNLLTNAVKYSPKGGKIFFSVRQAADKIEITVKDEGIGISEDDQKKLFQPFFRGSNIENISGTGLGLSILQRAVSLHKGTISFSSKVNEGTTFQIKIPFAMDGL